MKRLASLLLIAGLVGVSGVAPVASSATSFTYECTDPSGLPTTGCDVLLNPDIHGGTKGTVLAHDTSAGKRTITLPDGDHKVAVVGLARGSTGTNTAVLVMDTQPGDACQAGWAPLGYQAWWSDTGQDAFFESRHAHIDNLCWPVNNKVVSGTITFRFQVQLHNQPAGATLTRVRMKDYPSGTDRWVAPKPLPQPDAHGNLVAPFAATLNLDSLSAGRHEFRWAVYVTQPNGKVQLLSSRSEICIRSCSPAYRSGTWTGNGAWYENDAIGYEDVRIHSTIPTSGAGPAPTGTPTATPTPPPTPSPTLMPTPSVCP